jgi:N-acyl-D-aspartate/D-glutamate deacylase
VSHLKCETSLAWGNAGALLERVHGAGASGDQYPYTAWNSSLASLLPPWAPASDVVEIARRDGPRLRRAVEVGEPGFQSSVKGVGWDAMVALLGADPTTSCIGHAMHEDDVRAIVADPEVMVATDGVAMSPNGPWAGVPVHPREYGTFPRVLARYVRDEDVLRLEAAIRKMTSLPADRFGLSGRGRIAEGAFADLVVLDPERVRDRATFDEPHAFPDGIDTVVVNGRVAWDGSTGERAGRVLVGAPA